MSLTSLLSLSRFIKPSYNNNFALNKAKFYYTTMVSTEVQEQQQIELTAEQQIRQAEITRDSLDIVVKNRADPDIIEYKAYSHSSKSEKEHSLTATALRGPGMIIVPPLMFYNKTYTELTSVLHLGKNICGHDGIIHGGLAATMLDEALACVAIPALPNNFGFTANLNINYRRPIVSDQWVVMKSKLDKKEDRKAYVSASIESLDGTVVYTEATSLYVSPKSKPTIPSA